MAKNSSLKASPKWFLLQKFVDPEKPTGEQKDHEEKIFQPFFNTQPRLGYGAVGPFDDDLASNRRWIRKRQHFSPYSQVESAGPFFLLTILWDLASPSILQMELPLITSETKALIKSDPLGVRGHIMRQKKESLEICRDIIKHTELFEWPNKVDSSLCYVHIQRTLSVPLKTTTTLLKRYI